MGIYKCKSCLYFVTIQVEPQRQPLCPQCPHHPRMYPAHYHDGDMPVACIPAEFYENGNLDEVK